MFHFTFCYLSSDRLHAIFNLWPNWLCCLPGRLTFLVASVLRKAARWGRAGRRVLGFDCLLWASEQVSSCGGDDPITTLPQRLEVRYEFREESVPPVIRAWFLSGAQAAGRAECLEV